MKYDQNQLTGLAARIYAARIQTQPAFASDPTAFRQCITDAVNLIDEARKFVAELEPVPAKKPAAKKKPANKSFSFGAKR